MTTFHDDTHFLASLDPAQRDFIRRRLQPLIDRLQALVGGYPPLSAADPAAVPAAPRRAARAHPPRLAVDGVTYHGQTLPGSGRIRLVRDDGTAVAMWSASEPGAPGAPWVYPLEGFAAFMRSGHADAVHGYLLDIDRKRRAR